MGATKCKFKWKNRRTKTIPTSRKTQYRNLTTSIYTSYVTRLGPAMTLYSMIDDLEGLIGNTTATRAANYISSTERIILHSVAAAAKAAVTKTKNILQSGSNQ